MEKQNIGFTAGPGELDLIDLIQAFEKLNAAEKNNSVSGVVSSGIFWNLSWDDNHYLLVITKNDEEIAKAILSLIGFQQPNCYYKKAGVHVYEWNNNSG